MTNQREYFGINYLNCIIGNLYAKNIFFVTGKKSFELCGAKNYIENNFQDYNSFFFNDFSPNVKVEDIKKGLKHFNEKIYDIIVAIGGGSVIDMAKSINTFSHNSASIESYLKKEMPILEKGKPLIAIPTTFGSGSEATHFAVVYKDKKKYSLAHNYLLPDYCILDSNLTKNLPKSVAASSGMDALCQAVESYWSINSTEESKNYAKKAMILTLGSIDKAVNGDSIIAKQNMLNAANLAGKAINITKTTAPHAVSYTFTSNHGIPHGHAVGLILGQFAIYNNNVQKDDCLDKRGVEYVKQTIQEICDIFNVNNVKEINLKVNQIMENIRLETKLEKLGIDEKDLNELSLNFNLERAKNNPRSVDNKGLIYILKNKVEK